MINRRMFMKKAIILILCCVLCAFVFNACSGQPDSSATTLNAEQEPVADADVSSSAETIYLGLSIPMTGPGAESGLKQKFSVEFAIRQLNEAGGINGAQIALITLDDAQDAAQAATVAQTLCDDQRITAVIAHSASAVSAVTQPIFEENRMPNLHPGSSVDSLSSFGYEYWWRNYPRNSEAYPSMCRCV